MNEYSTPGYAGTVPGADWFIRGRRYHETARTQTENGRQTITLVPADAEPALGFEALRRP